MKSTSSQIGLNNYSAKAPKIVRKVKDEGYAGQNFMGFAVLVVWLFVSLLIVAPLAFPLFQRWTYPLLGLLCAWWGLYLMYGRGSKLEDSILTLRFMFDGNSGLHTIAKYDTNPAFLSDVFPLLQVHEDGLVEFKDKSFGVLLRYFPERIDDEAIKAFGQRMQLVIDGLYGEAAIKFISSSKNNMKRPILDRLLEAMNRNNNPKIFDYLHSIYKMIEGKENAAIEWTFVIFFSLGKYESLQDAIDMMEARVPGLQQSLHDEVGINTVKIINKMEIAKEYRQMCLPVVI
jgi:hypothetical protein